MASAVSDCKERCIHYWVCKNCEQYQQVIAKEVRLQSELPAELPDYVTAITEVSLLCKNQITPKYNNNSPKYLKMRDCHRCVHQGLCKYQEEYNKLCESLKNVKIPFSLGCPHHKELPTEDNK